MKGLGTCILFLTPFDTRWKFHSQSIVVENHAALEVYYGMKIPLMSYNIP